MKDVPKFVRQRMAQPAGGDHPEANLLAAFAEGGLAGSERELVLSHLGKCAACRETLAVAMPGITTEHSHPTAAPSGMRWLRWPMLRWAGVGAAVVVVAAAVVIQSSRRQEEVPRISVAAPAEKLEQAKQPAKPAAADEVAPALTDRVRKEAAIDRDARAKLELRADTKKDVADGKVAVAPPPPAPLVLEANKLTVSDAPAQPPPAKSYGAAQSARVRQYGVAQSGAKPAAVAGALPMEQNQKQASALATPIPSTNETVEVTGQANAEQVQQYKSLDRQQTDLDAMKGARGGPSAKARATTAGVPASVGGATSQVSSDSAAATVAPTMKAAMAIVPRWRLSSEGVLERSTNAGRTWQSVRVAAPSPALRSFSIVDRDIWAGGAGGALYHSADNGLTWAPVTVKGGDDVLDSDIVRVEFTDAQRGALMTVSGETWTTGDAGLTWSVRR